MIFAPKKKAREIKKCLLEEQRAKLRKDLAKTSESIVFEKKD